MKIKLLDLINAQQALMELGALTGLPTQTSYRVSRVIRKTRDELRGFSEARHKLIKQTAGIVFKNHPAVPGELWVEGDKSDPAALDAVDAEMKALGETEIDVDAHPMKLADFGDKVSLKPSWLADLHWLIVE
jgi:hypothetical protein